MRYYMIILSWVCVFLTDRICDGTLGMGNTNSLITGFGTVILLQVVAFRGEWREHHDS